MQKYWFTRNAIIKLLKSQIYRIDKRNYQFCRGEQRQRIYHWHGVRCSYKIKRAQTDAEFYFPETTPTCVNMKKITPEKVLHVLKTGENENPCKTGNGRRCKKCAGKNVRTCRKIKATCVKTEFETFPMAAQK